MNQIITGIQTLMGVSPQPTIGYFLLESNPTTLKPELVAGPFIDYESAYNHFYENHVIPYITSHHRHYRTLRYLTESELLERFDKTISTSNLK